MKFTPGDRVWWWHTANYMRRGVVHELDTDTSIGVLPDDQNGLLYLHASQLNHVDTPGGAP